MSANKEKVENIPKDAITIKNMLKELGVYEYQPSLINILLDFTYKYTTDVLEDAKVYSNHANKRNIDIEDVKLSFNDRTKNQDKRVVANNILIDAAKSKNSNPLPLIKEHIGLNLPPDRYCLLAPNYKMKSLNRANPVTSNSNLYNIGSLKPYTNQNLYSHQISNSQNINQPRMFVSGQNSRPTSYNINPHHVSTNKFIMRHQMQFPQPSNLHSSNNLES
ncbi:unnamed protein product [Gordionus sp. m RMFG-2023]|uniref:transcription initiation factor TFIID subunit 9B-like n=1 Tax=Gordionus sp. m RMFG-2023 TaxID=3053472 RepID=UPI0030DEACC4